MKKYVLVFATVLTLLMSNTQEVKAQKTFPDAPNQGYVDTGIGKGDLLNIYNEGNQAQTTVVYPFFVKNQILYEFVKDSSRMKKIDAVTGNSLGVLFSTSGLGNFDDADVAVTDSLVGLLLHNSSAANSELRIYSLNDGTLKQTIQTQSNGAIKARRLHANENGFFLFDDPNNRVVEYEWDTSLNQAVVGAEFQLSQFSGSLNDIAVHEEMMYILSLNEVYAFDMNGSNVGSYDVNSIPGASSTNFDTKRIVIEDNGRITVTTSEIGSSSPEQFLVFLTPELNLIDVFEIPKNGSRGSFGQLSEVAVDEAGNIYLRASELRRPIHQLEYVNHAPIYNSLEGPKTIINASNIGQSANLLPQTFVNDPEDYFDWNVNEGIGGIKITNILSSENNLATNVLRHDSDGNGSYETLITPGTEYEIGVEDLAQNRLKLSYPSNTRASVNFIKIAYELADRAGEYTGLSDTLLINTFKSRFEFDGIEGKDRWELMAPVIYDVTFEDYLSDLELYGNSCSECLPTENEIPDNLLVYNPLTEEYEPPTSLSDTLRQGDSFFILIPEDIDTATTGVQGGWPRTANLNSLEKETIEGFNNAFYTSTDDVSIPLFVGNKSDTLSRFGVSIVGNPFGQSWKWSSEFAQRMNVSRDIAIWNAMADSGFGAWEFPTYSGAQEVVIKPDQAFAVFATDQTANIEFKYKGIFSDQVSPITLEGMLNIQPKPTLTLHLESEEAVGDRFHLAQDGKIIPKPLNPTPHFHNVFALGNGINAKAEYFSKAQLFDTSNVETVVPFGLRSARVDTAILRLETKDFPEFDSVYVQHVRSVGDTVKIFSENDRYQIPLAAAKVGFEPEGDLALVFKMEDKLINSIEDAEDIPRNVILNQNYPNPFNPSTNISFSIPRTGSVKAEVFDMLGRKVATLVDGNLTAGTHQFRFDGSDLSSGIYFYSINFEGKQQLRKMMLIK
ncbi:MAG: T9SS type A sorting domain-containing protein [bacterium]|nr:T9SS type A sorting domain-containing protein [bacterium]